MTSPICGRIIFVNAFFPFPATGTTGESKCFPYSIPAGKGKYYFRKFLLKAFFFTAKGPGTDRPRPPEVFLPLPFSFPYFPSA